MSITDGPRIVTSGLVLNLDAANTKSYPGSGTAWTDISGNNYVGTLTNGPTFNSGNNGYILFDGTNDYTQFGDILDLGTNSLTISSWIYITSTPADDRSIVSKSLFGAQNYRYATLISPTRKFWAFVEGNVPTVVAPTGTTSLNTGQWYMVTAVFDRASIITLYINNQIETVTGSATISQFNGLNFQSSNPFRVGGYTDVDNVSAKIPFPGRIANTLVYFRALTAAEVAQNFNALRGRFSI